MTHIGRNEDSQEMLIGVDTGGTSTDFVLYDGRNVLVYKTSSTPADFSKPF